MKRSAGTFYCFSPPVMLATVVIETSLLLYTFFRYKLSPITRVVMIQLFFLALFQLSEYSVCGRFNLDAATWSRIGYVAITTLPALGVHLMQLVSGRGRRGLKFAAYATMAVWITVFETSNQAFKGHICAGNYVIFQLTEWAGRAYFGYYYFWLIVTMVLAGVFAYQSTKNIREALVLQIIGYLVFMVPTTILNNLYPGTRVGIPSIMCGFAVLYAFIMVFGIVPLAGQKSGRKLDKHSA